MAYDEEALLKSEYNTTPFAQGLTVDDYRDLIADHGTRIWHWQAYPKAPDNARGPNGEEPEHNSTLYVRSELDESVRAALEMTTDELYDPEFGVLARGQTRIVTIVDDIEFSRLDRVILPDVLVQRRIAFEPSGQAYEKLPELFVREIRTVWANGQELVEGEWQLLQKDEQSFIAWPDSVPTHPVLMTYLCNPQFIWLDVNDRTTMPGSDNYRLVQRGILTRENLKKRL